MGFDHLSHLILDLQYSWVDVVNLVENDGHIISFEVLDARVSPVDQESSD